MTSRGVFPSSNWKYFLQQRIFNAVSFPNHSIQRSIFLASPRRSELSRVLSPFATIGTQKDKIVVVWLYLLVNVRSFDSIVCLGGQTLFHGSEET